MVPRVRWHVLVSMVGVPIVAVAIVTVMLLNTRRGWMEWTLVFVSWTAAIGGAVQMVRGEFRRVFDERFNRGLCLTCGYDLRGSKERCPECGHAARPG